MTPSDAFFGTGRIVFELRWATENQLLDLDAATAKVGTYPRDSEGQYLDSLMADAYRWFENGMIQAHLYHERSLA